MLKKISDYFPITSDGIFTAFINPVWAIPFPDTQELDQYFILRYGDRIGNKMLDFYAEMLAFYDDFIGLSYTAEDPVDQNVYAKYFV